MCLRGRTCRHLYHGTAAPNVTRKPPGQRPRGCGISAQPGEGHSRGMLRATSVGGGPPPNPPPPGFLLGERPVASLEEYRALGGWQALEKARAMSPAAVIDEIRASGLRGRGGAGFPTGTKWASVREGGGRHHYAVCNGAEGEPATFKDRALMRTNPYQIIEGLLIAAHAVEAIEAYIAIKASFAREREALTRALAEIGAEGLADDIPVFLVTGPEEYLFGEEKALLEVIEGNDPLPRWLPPYLHGLFVTDPQLGWVAHDPEPGHEEAHEANPTLVNNV